MKITLLAVLAATVAFAAPAAAQTIGGAGSTSIDIPLSGTLAKKCSISAFLNGPFDALAMESTAVQGSESVSVNCNYGGTASVAISSANLGNLKSGANAVPYKLSISGSPFSSGVSLATPLVWSGWPTSANSNQTRSLSVQLDSIATIAGTYTDVVTAAVTPN